MTFSILIAYMLLLQKWKQQCERFFFVFLPVAIMFFSVSSSFFPVWDVRCSFFPQTIMHTASIDARITFFPATTEKCLWWIWSKRSFLFYSTSSGCSVWLLLPPIPPLLTPKVRTPQCVSQRRRRNRPAPLGNSLREGGGRYYIHQTGKQIWLLLFSLPNFWYFAKINRKMFFKKGKLVNPSWVLRVSSFLPFWLAPK